MNTINDLEIYAKQTSPSDIMQWLNERFETVVIIQQGKTIHDLEVNDQGQIIPVMVIERAVGKAWTSIWFKHTPHLWADDRTCAEDLNSFFHCRVRYSAALWQQGTDMDEWQQLDELGQQSSIQWPNSGN